MKSAVENILKKLNGPFVRFALFAVVAAVTFAAPLSIIWKYENTLRHGTLFKFRTKPVDPIDAFRGRYVTLSFEDDTVEQSKLKKTGGDDEGNSGDAFMYVRLATGADGFAKPVEISRAPLAGDDVITVDYSYSYLRNEKKVWELHYPFNRYYLPEDIAPEAEKLYREANRRADNARTAQGVQAERAAREAQKIPAYVAVRVRNGVGVIEELYLNGLPVREAVRAQIRAKMQQ